MGQKTEQKSKKKRAEKSTHIARYIYKVRYKTTENSWWREGIGIGFGLNDLDIIIDVNGKIVPKPIYDFRSIDEIGLGTVLDTKAYKLGILKTDSKIYG